MNEHISSVTDTAESPGITVGTLNAQFGNAIDAQEVKPDVLLLQEAVNEPEELEQRLHAANYRLAHRAGELGLAMAVRKDSGLTVAPGSLQTHPLQKMGRIEHGFARRLARRHGKVGFEMNAHGMQSMQLVDKDGRQVTVVNTRVTVPVKPLARRRQIRRINETLASNYATGPLIVGGDMNHFPGPKKADTRMHQQNRLSAVNLKGEPTWRAASSKLARLRSRLTGKPLEKYDAQPDVLLHRGMTADPEDTHVVDVAASDHRAIISKFHHQ